MTKHFAGLAVATLAALCAVGRSAHAVPGEPLKPYVVLVLDTSGSMLLSTNSGSPTCGGPDTRINHARCAINSIVNSYGDMVFALARFRETTSGTVTTSCDANGDEVGNATPDFPTPSGGDQCNTQGAYCGNCDYTTGLGNTCTNNNQCFGGSCSGGRCVGFGSCTVQDREFELLSPLVDGNNELAANWTDGACGTCSVPTPGVVPTSANEIWGVSDYTFTPLGAVLAGAKRYWLGAQATDGTTIWPSGTSGFAPIASDPTKTVFLPAGTCNSSPTCTTNCCAEQCRPYITILLTDGAETCTSFTNTTTSAASLLKTDVGGRRYRVETKPIGFGIAPGNAQIEGIAHAGGAPDAPGVNEGYYASDAAGLQLAISQILADAIRTESCNNLDDDCDTLVDEEFPNKGMACDNGKVGVCRTTGTLGCSVDGTGLTCNAGAGPAPGVETCNLLDDDCDGKTDEGLTGCTCVPQGEQCNGVDDDCDGKIDEGITRACGTGTCTGVETCTAGVFGGCTAPPFNPVETCNGIDDNCDGVIDGVTQACSNLVTAGGPATDNPGGNPASACAAEAPGICVCHPGQQVCPAGGAGVFGACLGEQGPTTEVCNGLDDDCDGQVDEGTGGADCSTNCGVGTTVCTNGTLMCNAMAAPNDDTCDGNDDDCDGNIDEDYVSPGACGAGSVCNGLEQCINGVATCIGDPILQESCNCTDDDCDGQTDEGTLCPSGATCTNCQCAFQCSPGEFPCPAGKRCSVDGFCIADPCFQHDCAAVPGTLQVCIPDPTNPNMPKCVNQCATVTCPTGQVCVDAIGDCRADDCTTFPDRCSATETCVAGTCVSNPCNGVTCSNGQYCVGGSCVTSCAAVDCPDGQRCKLGMCEADPCGHACPFGQVCNDDGGNCIVDPCTVVTCPTGQECDPNHHGACVTSLCAGTACPDPTQVCQLGTCVDPSQLLPDAAGAAIVTTGGGGGCSTSGGNGGVVSGLLLGLAALAQRKRRDARTAGGRS